MRIAEIEGAMEDDIVSDDIAAMSSSSSSSEGEERYCAPSRRSKCAAPQGRWHERAVQRVERWIFLYNVTTGLYMLDWWERCIFNAVFLVFFAVAGYNSAHYLQRIGAGLLAWAWSGEDKFLLGDGAAG